MKEIKEEKVEPKFKVGDKVYELRNRFECTIESIDETTYYGDTTNFDIKDQDNWELVEQKSADKIKPKFKVGDEIKTSNEESLTITKIDEKGYWSEDLFICDFDEECIWDLVGQKHTDKPKFHKGEWIVHQGTDNVYQVVAVIDNQYQLKYGDNYTVQKCADVDRCARLWDITKDAKDGDALAVEPIEGYYLPFIAIYKEGGFDFFNSHCFIGFDGIFYNGDTGHSIDNIHPATKEQRDTLERAMADAGYTFDFDKKELKKIEHLECSKDNLSDFESYLCLMFQKFRTKGICTNGEIVDFVEEHVQKLKNTLCPIWSKEDEEIYRKCICAMRASACGFPEEEKFVEQVDNWLKSLKERYTWKPSEEQLKSLQEVIDVGHFTSYPNALETLYEQLKQLR